MRRENEQRGLDLDVWNEYIQPFSKGSFITSNWSSFDCISTWLKLLEFCIYFVSFWYLQIVGKNIFYFSFFVWPGNWWRIQSNNLVHL